MKKPNMKRFIEDNGFLRIVAFLAAVLCWLVVQLTQSNISINDIREVPVTLAAPADMLTDLGLSPIDAEDHFVTVYMRGPRAVVGQLRPDDLNVVANIYGISGQGTYDLDLTLANQDELREKRGVEVDRFEPSTIRVRFDRLVTKTFELQPAITGLSVADGLLADQERLTPNKVTVTGPQADLDRIDRAVVELSLTEPLSRTYMSEHPILLLDAQGDPIDTTDRYIIMDSEQAQLMIRVLKMKVLPLVVGFPPLPLNFPLEELEQMMEMTAYEITVAGPVDIMDNYQEIVLGYIDIKSLSIDNHQFVFELELPSPQLSNIDSLSGVEVNFDTDNWATASFSTRNLRLANVPPGYEVVLRTSTLSNITLVGKKSVLDTVTSDDIVVTVDLSAKEVTPGQQTYPVKISLPTKGLVWATGDYQVIIQASNK